MKLCLPGHDVCIKCLPLKFPTYSVPATPSHSHWARPAPQSWTPTTKPSAFSPERTPSPPADRRSGNFLSRASVNALNWAERKTREAAERQVERQIAKAERDGTRVYRMEEDPREPRYLAQRREAFVPQGEAAEYYASGSLRSA